MNAPNPIREASALALPAIALGLFLIVVAESGEPFEQRPFDVAAVGFCFLALAAVLNAGTLFAARLHLLIGIGGAFASSVVVVWHVREELLRPHSVLAFGASVVALGVANAILITRLSRHVSTGRAGAALVASCVALLAGVFATFHASDSARWHLLRHNTLLGTPAYYLLAEPLDSVRSRMQERGQSRTPTHVPPGELPSVDDSHPTRDVVFALIDTLRADGLSAWGGEPEWMPRLGELAAQSTLFMDVSANSSWTRPSVGSFFTGLLPEHHGAVDRGLLLLEESTTLAEEFSDRGYETAAFVANFANVGIDSGFDQGFDHFYELEDDADPYARAQAVNEAVLEFLDAREEESPPLFLYVHYLDPHLPYLSGGGTGKPWLPSDAFLSYLEELRYCDGHVADFIEEAERRLDDPIVLLTSDHGEEFGDHGEFGHGLSLYRELVHLPMVVRGLAEGPRRIDARLEAADFFDLLLRASSEHPFDAEEWARSRVRRRGDRRYASSYLRTPSAFHRPYQTQVLLRSIDDGEHSLVWSGYGDTHELYSRDGDPLERKNTASTDRDRVRALLRLMDETTGRWAAPEADGVSATTLEMLRKLGYVQ